MAGRAIHAATLWLNDFLTFPTSHRDTFVNQLIEPDAFSNKLADSFWEEATDAFSSLELPEEREELSEVQEHYLKRN
ncbi:hypothetical protein NJ7G_3914 [Natrinema sp. J7-2]|nr:hypothetical protein NJ7G_3914 [Natrinema sp. J7-2]